MTGSGPKRPADPADREVEDKIEDEVEEAGEESFPASDPPAWTHVHPGRPAPSGDQPKPDRQREERKPGAGGKAG